MTPIPRHLPGLDADVVAQVDARLSRLVADEVVDVVLVVESGSRARGFPSPDSDDDCRFLYRRRLEDYLSCWPHRDVLETPLDAVLDVNGWDVDKAIRLLLRGNATVLEWLRSPLVYGGDADVRDGFLALAREVVDRQKIGSHYAHVGLGALDRHVQSGVGKAFLYALRPAVAVRWLLAHEADVVPPMDLPTLVTESAPPPEVTAAIDDLVARKAVTRELGDLVVPDVLHRFVADQLADGVRALGERPARGETMGRAREVADAFFRRTVLRADG